MSTFLPVDCRSHLSLLCTLQVLEVFESDINAQRIILLGDQITIAGNWSCQIELVQGSEYIVYGGHDILR